MKLMTGLQVETKICGEEEIVLNERFRKRMVRNIKRNKTLLEKLAKM
jgi:hypothetical protein